jgi:hypothetical protein
MSAFWEVTNFDTIIQNGQFRLFTAALDSFPFP